MHKVAAFLLALPMALGAQGAPKDTAAIARRLISAAKYATFITLDEQGAPRSRMVQPKAPERDFTVWFATNPRTRKVQDIARNTHVVLHYFDPVREGYVSIVGTAVVARDKATKDAHWDPAWNGFYKDRENGVVLIRVTPDHLEIVSDKDHITGDNATWRPPVWTPKR
jgi:general stress protein 26